MGFNQFYHSGFLNAEYYDEMYKKYLADPQSVDLSWRRAFDWLGREPVAPDLRPPTPMEPPSDLSKGFLIFRLIDAYRHYGHYLAKTNPLAETPPEMPNELKLSTLGFTEEDLDAPFPTAGLAEEETLPLRRIIGILQEIYCGKVGVEYMDSHSPELEEWLQKQIEPNRFKIELSIEQKQMILQHLNKSGLFETFLQTKYVGQKRFSLEGGETLIPMLAAILETGNRLGMEDFVIGMAHRGRLNVLTNILGKSYSDVFSEFEDFYSPETMVGSGDVKYHKGFKSEVTLQNGNKVKLTIPPNASHLESTGPIVEGLVRAKQTLRGDQKKEQAVVPILIHGDAALSGQGVVYETMQFSKLRGYSTGGTLHLVINNQIGFTTLPEDSRSTYYCTDIAKAFGAPVFHVNAEEPEAAVYATILAVELRQKFGCDVFIDLQGYRKYGHNESDEPAFTQPSEYRVIRQKPSIREIYRDQLLKEGSVEKILAEELEETFKKGLQLALQKIKDSGPPKRGNGNNHLKKEDFFTPVKTGVPLEILQTLAKEISEVPEGFAIHRKLRQLIDQRHNMVLGKAPLDWGMAELMAYATLLNERTSIRISGQDSCRGTFSHRHALWKDQEQERDYFPLQHLTGDQGQFHIFNSHLSEYAVLGFEYGYSIGTPKGLTIWEAQFGDFANGAQIIIDQYLSTGEQKWGQKSNLVLFLPHGYEGQGPEHSSARMERFLTLCGEDNLVIVQPSTPAQFFHVIRRQMIRPVEKPMIVFTPKALLRLPECVSPVEELVKGVFSEILDDPEPPKNPTRLALCTGRIYYDLLEERKKQKNQDLVLIRIEQLYPFDQDLLNEVLRKYKGVTEWMWVQDEPSNMGAWGFIRHFLAKAIPKGGTLLYAGRDRSASPATGSHKRHEKEHHEILKAVFPGSEKFDVPINLMTKA